jgi:N-methylhydantoinase B
VRAETAPSPFVLQIIEDAFLAICDEMFSTTQRTSQSTIVYEVLDLAVGLTDARGRLISQGNGVPFFLGVLDQAVVEILRKFGPDGIAEGDIFLTNDPYRSGTHLSDVTVVAPIFHDGGLVGFAANKAHWIDVGGKDAGSVSTDSNAIFQEGLQLPYVRLFHAGVLDASLLDMIDANVRTPSMSVGDLFAQIASVRVASSRFDELCTRHGIDTIETAIERTIAHSRELVLLELERLPHGNYRANDWIDDDGFGRGPFPVCVTVTISAQSFVCDFTGTHEQLESPMNCSQSALVSACRVMFKAVTAPHTPLSGGSFAGLEVICPPRTIFTAERPAPVSTYYEVLCRVSDLIWKALAPSFPASLSAGHFSSVGADLIVGDMPESGETFILFEPTAGGWGAGIDKDGERGVFCISDGDTYSIPVEVAETKYGVLVEEYSFNLAGGGAGRRRGGEGVRRDYRITGESATVTAIFTRHDFPPWGVDGGRDGSPNEITVIPADGTQSVTGCALSRYPLRMGDIVSIVTGTGGGWGDPLLRESDLVARDVRNGFVTLNEAREVYGVVVDAAAFTAAGVGPAWRALSAR